jgi:hypothetical protein
MLNVPLIPIAVKIFDRVITLYCCNLVHNAGLLKVYPHYEYVL